ncbi:oligosaccharide flippase family protein [uncultured Tolumonas sp.]|uniref:oligosaccharide flippase family protein n=1 Tax=uncultured Tolumonas sp. TaxID=263765 RepID=UPI002A0A6CCC|nr:oligosaccharide flippase family protein [uncultured Tolumonas sp.]
MFSFIRTVAGGNLLLTLLTLISGVILARFLNANGRGELSSIITIVTFISTLSNLSIPDYLVKNCNKKITSKIFFIISIFTLTISFVIFLLGWYSNLYSKTTCLLVYFICFIPINFLSACYLSILQGQLRFTDLMRIKLLLPCLSSLLIVILFFLNEINVFNVILVYLVANAFVLVFSFLSVKKIIDYNMVSSDFIEVITNALKIHPVSILVLISVEIDKILFVGTFDNITIGNYFVAISLPLAMTNLIISTMQTLLLPIYNEYNLDKNFNIVTRFLFLVVFPFYLLCAGVIGFAIKIMYGQQYFTAATIAPVVLLGLYFSLFRRVHAKTIRCLGLESIFLLSELLYVLLAIASFEFLRVMNMLTLGSAILLLMFSSFIVFVFSFFMLFFNIKNIEFLSFFSYKKLISDIRQIKSKSLP